jgi:hypothetical protein
VSRVREGARHCGNRDILQPRLVLRKRNNWSEAYFVLTAARRRIGLGRLMVLARSVVFRVDVAYNGLDIVFRLVV